GRSDSPTPWLHCSCAGRSTGPGTKGEDAGRGDGGIPRSCYDAAMKRVLHWLNSIVTYAALIFLLVAGVAGSLTGKPLLLTAVRSQSMAPTLVRGDMVVLWPIEWTEPRVGDVLVFRV